MKKKSGLLLLLVLGIVNFSSAQDEELIRKRLDQQTGCWNKGNLECFMDTYWHSDSLMFIGKNGITYGWENVLGKYRQNYPDRLAMGNLQFDILTVKPVSGGNYFVVGKWFVTRPAGDLKGYFSLLWKKIEGEWYIVADHSSAEE